MGVLAEVSGDSWKAGWEVQDRRRAVPASWQLSLLYSQQSLRDTKIFNIPLGMPCSVKSSGV